MPTPGELSLWTKLASVCNSGGVALEIGHLWGGPPGLKALRQAECLPHL